MKLMNVENLDYSQDLMPQIFCSALGENNGKISINDFALLGDDYSDDITYENLLYDENNNPIACVMKKNGLIGAYDINGKLYAPFKYQSVSVVTSAFSNVSKTIYSFKKDDDICDLFNGTELLFEDAYDASYVKDAHSNEEGRFLSVISEHEDFIFLYDLETNRCIADFPYDDYFVEEVHSKFELIIYSEKETMGMVYHVIDYNHRIILDSKFYDQCIYFTNCRNFYKTRKELLYGLIHYDSGSVRTVLPNEYVDILKVLPDKAVVVNDRYGIMQIVSYSQDNMGKWNMEVKFENEENDVESIEIFEGEDEAILLLEKNYKILLSHYLKDNNLKYRCNEILYEGNGIFKCFNEDTVDFMDITYICCEQAVNYASQNDNELHAIYVPYKNDGYIFVKPNGYIVFMNDHVDTANPLRVNRLFWHSLMTVEPDGTNYLWETKGSSLSAYSGHYVIDGISRETFLVLKDSYMIWHNLFVVDMKLHLMGTNINYPNISLDSVLGIFNDYIVIRHGGEIYVCDKGWNYFNCRNEYYFDEYYQKLITRTKDTAYAISNDGIEYFDAVQPIFGKQVYKSRTTNNYIIDLQYVYLDNLKKDFDNKLIDSAYMALF